jgi:hypothetical protein
MSRADRPSDWRQPLTSWCHWGVSGQIQQIRFWMLPISILPPTMILTLKRMVMTAQLSMFADDASPKATPTADLDRVRRKLASFLAEASEAGVDGLPTHRRRLMQTVVPQMVSWLPSDEAEQTKKAFGEALAD